MIMYKQSTYSNNYHSELNLYSSNPQLQKMAAEHLKIYGSIAGVINATYQTKTSTINSKNISDYDNVPSINSNGKYMIHYYYGCQPGNRITTVIG
jgi:hypothetical protein